MTIWCDCIAVPHKGEPEVVTGKQQAENQPEFQRKYLVVLTPMSARHYIAQCSYQWEKVAKLLEFIERSGRAENVERQYSTY